MINLQELALYVDARKKEGPYPIDLYHEEIQEYKKKLVQKEKVDRGELLKTLKSKGHKGSFKNFEDVVREDLLNEAFKYSQPYFCNLDQEIIMGMKQFALMKLLTKRRLQPLTRSLSQILIELGQKHGIFWMTLEALNTGSTSLSQGSNKKKLEAAHRLEREVIEQSRLGALVASVRQKASFVLYNKLHDATEYIDQIYSELLELKPQLNQETPVMTLHLYGMTEVICYWERIDYVSIKEACQKYIEIICDREGDSYLHLQFYYTNLTISLLYLGSYEEALTVIDRIDFSQYRGTHNWACLQLSKVACFCYLKKYDHAYQATLGVISHKKHKLLQTETQEEWHIVAALMALLINLGKVTPLESDNQIKNFKLYKFLNEVPQFFRHKRSENATILILHICHLIADKKYDLAFDRMEALEKYSNRHLRKANESYRLNCFLKMILEIPKAGFHRAGVERRTQKYLELLSEVSIGDVRQSIIVEMVPFEDLWEMILSSLENRHVRGRW